MKRFFRVQSPARLISLGFAATILLGSALLMLPCSVRDGAELKYIDALYTSTSAVCVTGLIAVDAWLFCDGKFKQGLARRTGFAVACFAAPMAVYYLWNVRYVGWLVSRNASEGGVGETTASMGAVVINGIKILLGRPVTGFFAEREPQFRQAMGVLLGPPIVGGNRIDTLVNGDRIFPAMLRAHGLDPGLVDELSRKKNAHIHQAYVDRYGPRSGPSSSHDV